MTATRPPYMAALAAESVMAKLARFDPRVAGTPPLGLTLPSSDVDVLCHAPDPHAFAGVVWHAFGHLGGFRMWQWSARSRAVIARFAALGWEIELFGQDRPVSEQTAWRHFQIERRLLDLGGRALRDAIIARRRTGLKTEPAFADLLMLAGDPYDALLNLESVSDRDLCRLLSSGLRNDRMASGIG